MDMDCDLRACGPSGVWLQEKSQGKERQNLCTSLGENKSSYKNNNTIALKGVFLKPCWKVSTTWK